MLNHFAIYPTFQPSELLSRIILYRNHILVSTHLKTFMIHSMFNVYLNCYLEKSIIHKNFKLLLKEIIIKLVHPLFMLLDLKF